MTTRTFHIGHSVIRDDNVTVIGSFNKIYGHNCRVEGGHNELFGNNCEVIGDFNRMHGSGCTATGDHNTDYFGNARMYGSFNSVRRGESDRSRSGFSSQRQNIVISNENESLVIDGDSYNSPGSFTSNDGRTSVTYAGPGGLCLNNVSNVRITRRVVGQPQRSPPPPPTTRNPSPPQRTSPAKTRPDPLPNEPAAEEGDTDNLCTVCMERTIKTVNVPCGHQVQCVTCSIDIRLTKCPVCRGELEQIIRTYK